MDKLKDTGSREKPRMRWLDSIKEATGLRLEDLREAVQDRKMAYAGRRKDSK